LAAFAEIYKTDEKFKNAVSLKEEDKTVLTSIETEVKNLWLEKLVWWKEISWEITDFANAKTEYDGKIKESLDTSWLENIKISSVYKNA